MTDDLVKRLRHGTAGDKERHAAADRIEKLGMALREVLNWVDHYSVDAAYDDHWPAIEELAREALEGKDD